MRILRCIFSVNPADGGPVTGLMQTAKAMAAHGIETEIVTLDDPQAAYVRDCPFRVHACGPATGRLLPGADAYTHWIERHAPDYDGVVIHGLWNFASTGAWQALSRRNVPYVLFVHGMMDPWFAVDSPAKHVKKQVFWWAAQGRVLRDAARVLFTCRTEMMLARGAFWGARYRGQVVRYGTGDIEDAPDRQQAAFRDALPDLGNRGYLLFLSRIHPKKGCDLLIEAFAKAAAARPGLDLVMAGPDQVGWQADLAARARELGIGERVHWPGMLQGDAKAGAFRGADAFVLPSHQENFGIVVAEAMACGTPVLMTDKVNIWREVAEDGAGLVEADTREGIAALLARWLDMPPEAQEAMGAAARSSFEARFAVEAAAEDLLSVLRQVREEAHSAGRSARTVGATR